MSARVHRIVISLLALMAITVLSGCRGSDPVPPEKRPAGQDITAEQRADKRGDTK